MKPWLRRVVWALASVLLGLCLLMGGLWLWAGSDASLAVALRQVQGLLPAGQTLQTREVSGSLRSGGRIGWLRWQQGDLSVEAQDITLAWEPTALLQRELRLSQLQIGRLSIHDQRPPKPAAASTPPTDLGLPFRVNADVRVAVLAWIGTSTQQLEQISFHYVFDSYLHKLDKGQSLFSSNIYQFSGQLQARGDMALELQVAGAVDTPVPGSSQPLHLNAQARLHGALAGPQAELVLQADLKPPPTQDNQSAMQASLSARIAPWQAQQIAGAQAQWQALNLASVWPQAPQTVLTGNASVRPQGTNWQASIALDNTLSGPWNEQRLPVQQVKAELTYASGHWLLQSLQALAAGGSVQAQGQLGAEPAAGTPAGTTPALWRSTAQGKGITPAAIDSRLAPDAISGTISARQTSASPAPAATPLPAVSAAASATDSKATSAPPADQFSFELDLQSSSATQPTRAATAPLASLHLQSLKAQGNWAAPQLLISTLQLTAQQAQLQGQLKVNTANFATQGRLNLTLPGLQAEANGLLAPADGQGTLSIQLQDAALASRWLSHWPDVKTQLAGAQIRGQAALSARWQGGWQQDAQAMTLNASLTVPQLEWLPAAPATATAAPAAAVKLQDTKLEASGHLSNLQVASQGQVTWGVQKAQWLTQATAGRVKDGSWQASLTQAQLSWRGPHTPQPWQLRLGVPGTPAGAASTSALSQPLSLRWQPGLNANTLSVSAGSARLQGPSAGTAGISWQPLLWSQANTSGQAARRPAQWRSQGRIDGVPLTWLDAFMEQPLADLGVKSDVLLSGSWDASFSDTLHLQATLERSAGDVRIQAEAGRSTALAAGLQEAWMQVNLDGEQVSGSLRWDSQRAGKALAAFGTQLKNTSSGLTWPTDAPLGGSLQLQLPPADAWSALAPPGWRLRGTVDTHIDLTGTRAKPQWEGTLRARDLALRSVVDGIDFNQGLLDARLHGQQMDIQTFTLRGAGTPQNPAAGGQISLTGSVFWLPDTGQTGFAQRFQMALQAQLSALRLSTRPDRRLVVSGQLQANLKDARLTLRGSLSADQALFTLPDDSTPSLDDDVRVRPVASAQSSTSAKNPAAASQGIRITPDVSVNLDLGPDFQVRGRGLQARLAGKLVLTAVGNDAPELVGSIRAVNGTYQAYGQRLQIQRGLIRFYGPINNPALAILAIRPKLTQRVGVQVSGTALSPVVALYSDPGLSDVETLTWLVLGRSSSAGGAEAALMQQAALALLGGNGKSISDSLSKTFGLDELSFRAGESGDANNTASSASITLGKRLSEDFYVAYESSLGGAMGVFYIFYDLSKYLTLRAQTGEQSAVDLIWTRRYD